MPKDIDPIKVPSLFACAESDWMFNNNKRTTSQKILEAKQGELGNVKGGRREALEVFDSLAKALTSLYIQALHLPFRCPCDTLPPVFTASSH